MKHAWLVLTGVAVVLCAAPALADGFNEIINGDFGTGDLSFWQHGVDVMVGMDGPTNAYAATCKCPGGDLWLRQVVDDTRSPDWNWYLHQKVITLMADIAWSGWVPSDAAVSFRLDWWDERYNNVEDPITLPHYPGPPAAGSEPAAGYFVTEWVSYGFSGIDQLHWVTVKPFDELLLPVQPRWVSVDIVFTQPVGVSVWLDNVVLTGKCVPEPAGVLALIGGCSVFLGVFRLRRR